MVDVKRLARAWKFEMLAFFRTPARWPKGVLALLLCVCMLGLGIGGLVNWIPYIATIGWQTTDWRITNLEANPSCPRAQERSMFQHCCKLKCTYAYEVDGQQFTNDRIAAKLLTGCEDRGPFYKVLKTAKQKNKTVPVLVNPRDPSKSVLFRELSSDMFFGPLLAAFFFYVLLIKRWPL